MDPVLKLAADFADERVVLFLGPHVGYPVALEGALKLKELRTSMLRASRPAS